jgi:WD40 repeat protein
MENRMLEMPYKGVDPYQEEDAIFFFGRDSWRQDITRHLQIEKLTVLHGESGVGKSSLLRAGVTNSLRLFAEENRKNKRIGVPKFAVVVFKDWDKENLLEQIMVEVQKSINEAINDDGEGLKNKVEDRKKQLKQKAYEEEYPEPSEFILSLQAWAETVIGVYREGKLLIIFDQFEDYFQHHPQNFNDNNFIRAFADAVNSYELPVNFLVSIQSHSLFKLGRLSGFIPEILENLIELKHLDKESAKEAIQEPVKMYNRRKVILDNLQEFPLTILYGDRGVGKTILLLQGVHHYLCEKAKQNIEDKNKPKFIVVFFDSWYGSQKENLLERLKQQVKQEVKQVIQDYKREEAIPTEISWNLSQTLEAWAEFLWGSKNGGYFFFIFDQFEEFLDQFEKCADEESCFIAELSEALDCPNLCIHLLVSVSTQPDNVDRKLIQIRKSISKAKWTKTYFCLTQDSIVPYSNSAINQEKLEIPNFKEVDKNLIDQIVKDLQSKVSGKVIPDQIEAPYLQLVMKRLWEKEINENRSNKLRLATYADPEENRGLGGHKKIIERHLESQMAKLESESDKEVASHIFHYLVTPSYAKQSLDANDLCDLINDDLESYGLNPNTRNRKDIARILKALSDSRILKTVKALPDREEPRYEIYHDALAPAIINWRSYYSRRLQNLAIKRGIAAQALYHQRLTHDELAALLARQAYYFNQKDDLQIVEQVDEALRTSLVVKHFSNILESYKGGVRAVAFSPDGQQLASASYEGTIWLWDLRHQPDMKPILLKGYWDSQFNIAPIRFWNLLPVNGLLWFLLLCECYRETFTSLSFSDDGEKLASGNWDGTVLIWEKKNKWVQPIKLCDKRVESFEPIEYLIHHMKDRNRKWTDDIQPVAFSPTNSELLASGTKDGKIRLWYLEETELQYPIILNNNKSKHIRSIAFSQDGKMLASGGEDGTVFLWKDLNNPGKKKPLVMGKHCDKDGNPKPVNSVAFSPDDKTIVSGGDDWKVRQWSTQNPNEVLPPLGQHEDEHQDQVNAVAFSPDGQWVASGGEDQTVRIWNPVQPGNKPEILTGHHFGISSVAFFFKDKQVQLLASGSWDYTVRLWNLSSSEVRPKKLCEHQENVMSVAFSQDGHWLASGSWDKTVILSSLKDLFTSKLKKHKDFKLAGHKDEVYTVAFFFNEDKTVQLLATGSKDGTILLWDLKNIEHNGERPQAIKKLVGHTDGVSSVAFSPDGHWLLSGSWKDDATVRLWDLRQSGDTVDKCQVLWKHGNEQEQQSVTSVAFSSDGQIIASGSDDTTIKLLDLRQGFSTLEKIYANPDSVKLIELKGHTKRVWSIAFQPVSTSSNKMILASGSDDKTVILWNLDSTNPGKNFIQLEGYGYWVGSVAFSPDGKTLASGCYDKTIRLWDLEKIDWEKQQLEARPIILRGHDQAVTSVAFSPDGKYVASGSYDNTVLLWIARTEILADMVCDRVLRNLTLTEWQQFFGEYIPYMITCPNLPPDKNAPSNSEKVPFYTK